MAQFYDGLHRLPLRTQSHGPSRASPPPPIALTLRAEGMASKGIEASPRLQHVLSWCHPNRLLTIPVYKGMFNPKGSQRGWSSWPGQARPPNLTADSGPLSYVNLFSLFRSACPFKEGIPLLSVPPGASEADCKMVAAGYRAKGPLASPASSPGLSSFLNSPLLQPNSPSGGLSVEAGTASGKAAGS